MTLALDSSTQHGYEYFCMRQDGFVFPAASLPRDRCAEAPKLLRSVISPLTCLGFRAGDLAHKLRALLHTARASTGSDEALLRWRWAH
eukprot:1617804-Alexandrium_andersonii.AAC.1